MRFTLAVGALAVLSASASAQISLTGAVDLALQNTPRVRIAQADVARALAVLQQTRDVYIPSVSIGGSGYGKSYGFPLGQPTLFNLQAQSLVFSYSQRDYIRSAHAGLVAANLALAEARQAVAEDTALTCLALDHDAGREAALGQQQSFATRLVSIVQDRLDAGQDTPIDLTTSRLVLAQIHLKLLQSEDDLAIDRGRLADLTGLPAENLTIAADSIPVIPQSPASASSFAAAPSPGIAAAFANARAKREQAFGDARYLFRPQISFAAQYSRLSTFSNSNYLEYFGRRDPSGNLLPFPSDAIGIGLQVNIPLLDYGHRAQARQSAAEAAHAENDARQQRDLFTEGRLRTEHATLELAARAEVADLDQKLAQQQLDVLSVQLQSPPANGTPMTPKDEQNSRILERDKYLTLLDARFQLRQAQINLLRQTGELESWLKSTAQTPAQIPAQTGLQIQSQTEPQAIPLPTPPPPTGTGQLPPP